MSLSDLEKNTTEYKYKMYWVTNKDFTHSSTNFHGSKVPYDQCDVLFR